MAEFEGSTPIGGVKILVEMDETPYQKALAGLKARVAKNEGMPRLKMASTAQQAFAARWGMNNGNGSTAPGGHAAPNWGTPGGGGGGGGGGTGGAAPGRAPGPAGNRQPAAQPGNAGGGAGGTLFSGVNFFKNLRGLSGAYGAFHAVEAIEDFTSAAIEASRSMRAAANNKEQIAASVQYRRAGESALSQIPLIGPLLVSSRRLIDTIGGSSPEDIDREMAEANRTRDAGDSMIAGRAKNRVQAAQTRAASFYSGNLDTDKALISAQFAAREAERSSRLQSASEKYQPTKTANDYMTFLSNNTIPQQAYREALVAADNKQLEIQRDMVTKPIKAEQELNKAQETVLRGRVQFESDQLRFRLQNQELVAKFTAKQKFVQSDVVKRWGDFMEGLTRTPKELQGQYFKTTLATLAAERGQMIADVGRTYATPVDVRRDIVGDPSGIRHLQDPMTSLEKTIRGIFSFGATVLGR